MLLASFVLIFAIFMDDPGRSFFVVKLKIMILIRYEASGENTDRS